jgi:hypothetical protein
MSIPFIGYARRYHPVRNSDAAGTFRSLRDGASQLSHQTTDTKADRARRPMPNVEQLKMIEAVVSRLAGNSFLLKGWTVIVVAGLTAFAKADSNRAFALIAVIAVIIFGTLDAYYVALERAYRKLYEAEAAKENSASWTLRAERLAIGDVWQAVKSPAVFMLHGMALGLAIAVAASA